MPEEPTHSESSQPHRLQPTLLPLYPLHIARDSFAADNQFHSHFLIPLTEMERVPNEVLDLIIGRLSPSCLQHDLCQARLVCRKWNQLAIRHLFSTVTLYNSDKTADDDFQSWNNLMDLQTVKNTTQRVIIETCPPDLRKDENTRWDLWEGDGHWPAFTSAIHRITDLDHLQAIEVHFSFWCRGVENPYDDYYLGNNDREMPSARAFALEAIHEALKQREGRRLENNGSKITPVRELKLEKFQNNDPPEVLVNGLLKNIDRLSIRILDEENLGEATGDFELVERFNFDSILRNTLLMPVMDQVVELSLSAQYEWGLLPSRFEGKGLIFPNLKKLSLGDFVIGHYDQLDWVIDQKTLTCLRLHDCQIVTHFHFVESNVGDWEVDTDDWESFDGEPWFDWYPNSEFYAFSLRWNTVFETIRDGLPKLTNFGATWGNDSDPFANIYCAGSRESMRGRYRAFDAGNLPTPFVGESRNGEENDENDPESPWNLDNFAYETDGRALNTLLQAVYERRRCMRNA